MQESVVSFASTAAVVIVQACLLLLAVSQSTGRRTASQYNSSYELKFRALKYGRTITYATLAACQAALVLWHAAQHWPALVWDIDGSQALVLAVYGFTLAVLCARWQHQLSLHLSAVLLVALLEPSLLFWQDITGVRPDGSFDVEHIARVLLHCVQFVLLLALLVAEVIIQQHQLLQKSSSCSSSGGLPVTAVGSNGSSYQPLPGSAEEATDKHQQPPHGKQEHNQPQTQQRKFFRAWRPGDSRWHMAASAFHYVWPSESTLRLRLLLCLLMVLSERVINLAAPIAFKNMVEVLSKAAVSAAATGHVDGQQSVLGSMRQLLVAVGSALQPMHAVQHPELAAAAGPHAAVGNSEPAAAAAAGVLQDGVSLTPFWVLFYPWVFVYLGAFFLRGGSGSEGLLANLRDILWIPITQAAFRRISNDVFGHLLELDLNFHVHRKTGQIMRILDRGTSSIQDTVSIILFNVMPQLIDILVACTYLASALKGPWVALIVLFTVGSYVPLTLLITEQRGKVRKVMNALDNERESRATDMLLNYETIKYFCAEGPELNGYDTATRKYQAAEYWQMAFLSLLSLVQSLVVWLGLAAGLVFCIWGSSRGRVSVGDTVLFISMMQQLYVPLTFFGSYYRQVTKALIDMENMFELLATQPRVQDAPHAVPLRVSHGTVEFQQVVFSYNPSPTVLPVLRGLSFLAPGGHSLAVVGSTGSGKSTLLRLLLRFYDPQSGRVCIDGQDIRRCTQASVRGAIGVVPQDCVLFNDTIMYNIRYGRPAASDGQVYEAAQVSHIHDHLMRFPQGYSTRVGERGLRLSGGEKQRVAFARAVLKGPAIMVLDEATSSLDSLTERLIQDSLRAIRGRCTQVIVAHRLSTIMDADQILVLAKGQVAECGSHTELVLAGGLYASMWARQQDSSSAAPSPGPKQPPAAARMDGTDDGSSSGGGSNDGSSNDGSNKGTGPPGCDSEGGGLRAAGAASSAAAASGINTQRQEPVGSQAGAAVGGSGDSEIGIDTDIQVLPAVLPPLPRVQRRLRLPPQQQQQRDGDMGQQQQQHDGGQPQHTQEALQHGDSEPNSGGLPGRLAVGAAAAAAGEGEGGGSGPAAGQNGKSRPRPGSKLRCNSSCGHGRHANFWSREQVDDASEQDDDAGDEGRQDDAHGND